ncbi:uncharacterized protein K452DRAFT_217416 [Aplosporella prunicola CBS 121167]|uniref:CinA C-terminal domain-containing protein n=1 Tax=Aplosporella prunicola CBS 121167 TaxID=1176127 RepID=A0A6A6BSV4_9PEZI|nr:uncharacterized protein K452DRAFT_217416 [Aplosporella prunicola CBS 121167]KAF2147199.1 hypothetical protein K452DRAFT_217416 [Aplosporella prunicola CBS 121167]
MASSSSSSSAGNGGFLTLELRAIASEVAGLLRERGETVAVAETVPGGLISAALLATHGASKIYKGGLTLYTLESRIAFAGWTHESTVGYTGPTPAIVAGLAAHTRATLGATYAVSESGTAGPTGGETRNRTPGYVALAVGGEAGTATREVETGLGGDREGNMVAFAVEGLKLLRDVVRGEAKLG